LHEWDFLTVTHALRVRIPASDSTIKRRDGGKSPLIFSFEFEHKNSSYDYARSSSVSKISGWTLNDIHVRVYLADNIKPDT